MEKVTLPILKQMLADGVDFEALIRSATQSSSYQANLFTLRAEDSLNMAFLAITWSWRRGDITHHAMADATIESNSYNWSSAPFPTGMPERIQVIWRGTAYVVELVHLRTVGSAPYKDGGPFHVKLC